MAVINIRDKIVYFLYSIVSLMLLVNIFASEALAEDYVTAQGYTHIFNNNISVYTGIFALNKDITLDTSAYFKFTMDSIEGVASADVTSGASSATISTSGDSDVSDTRNELTAGLTHNFNNIIGIEVYYDYSKEKDYISSTPTITLKKDLFEKNTTLTLGYSRNMDTLEGRFMTKSADKDTDNYFFGITQVISPVAVAQIGYSRSEVSGRIAEGIRLVPIDGTTMADCVEKSATCVDEVFPDSRARNAVMFGVNYYFKDAPIKYLDFMSRSSIQLNLRYYTDDWGITSHTEEVAYYKYITEQTILRLNGRYYDQTKADFVKDDYTGADTYRTSSPQLVGFDSQLVGIKLIHTIPDRYRFSWIDKGTIEGKYELYTQSTKTNANIFMVGLRLSF